MFQFIDFQRICISPHSEKAIRHVLHIAVHGPSALGRIAEEISSQRRGYSPIERCIVGRCTGTMHRKSPVFGIAHQLFPPPCRREGRKTFRECESRIPERNGRLGVYILPDKSRSQLPVKILVRRTSARRNRFAVGKGQMQQRVVGNDR